MAAIQKITKFKSKFTSIKKHVFSTVGAQPCEHLRQLFVFPPNGRQYGHHAQDGHLQKRKLSYFDAVFSHQYALNIVSTHVKFFFENNLGHGRDITN